MRSWTKWCVHVGVVIVAAIVVVVTPRFDVTVCVCVWVCACVRAQLRSPQLQQALGSLTAALQSDNFESIFANFNLRPADGVDAINVGDGSCVAACGGISYHQCPMFSPCGMDQNSVHKSSRPRGTQAIWVPS